MKLIIIKINETVFRGELKKLSVPGIMGDMEILPGHAAFLTPLKSGIVKYLDEKDNQQKLEIEKGFVEVNKDEAIVIL